MRRMPNESLTALTVITLVALIGGVVIAIATTVVSNNELTGFGSPEASTRAAIAGWETLAGWCITIGSFGLIATLGVRAVLAGFGKLDEPLAERPQRTTRATD